MTKSAGAMDEADHAARLMSVAMALQSGRYSMDIMRIAEALTRQ
jgi:anti-sigma28 factor (negative regulator of flagellin synthesis)